MRIAIIADIHGNPLALDAVLADIQRRGGVDGYWILGDLCAIGFDPAGVLDRLAELPNALFVRGNADRYVITGERPDPTFEQAAEDPRKIPIVAEVAGSFAWTQGAVEARGWMEWMKALPTEHRLTLPGGQRVLLVHSTPSSDDGAGLNPGRSDEVCQQEIEGCEADLICVGHFHMAMDRRLNGTRVINPGAVSNNFAFDLRAGYAILSATSSGYDLTFYRVDYDRQAAINRAKHSSNSGVDYIVRILSGQVRASWMNGWDEKAHYPVIVENGS